MFVILSELSDIDTPSSFRVSPRLEQKILYYLAVLCLIVDQWDVDLFDLKHDLNIPPREYVSFPYSVIVCL
jgi:hypothetical protein